MRCIGGRVDRCWGGQEMSGGRLVSSSTNHWSHDKATSLQIWRVRLWTTFSGPMAIIHWGSMPRSYELKHAWHAHHKWHNYIVRISSQYTIRSFDIDFHWCDLFPQKGICWLVCLNPCIWHWHLTAQTSVQHYLIKTKFSEEVKLWTFSLLYSNFDREHLMASGVIPMTTWPLHEKKRLSVRQLKLILIALWCVGGFWVHPKDHLCFRWRI